MQPTYQNARTLSVPSKKRLYLTFLLILCSMASCSPKPDRENVVLITIDTLRADHLGCYGYPRQTSPAIDALASDSVLFEKCVSQATSTVPSHASILTSLHPPSHGVIHNLAKLPKTVPSLVRVFRDSGYLTGAIVSNIVLRSEYGLNQGFMTYDENLDSPELNRKNFLERHANETTDRTIDWLKNKAGKEFFLWVHYIDPHGAYYPPPEYRKMFVGDALYSTNKQEFPISNENVARNAIPHYQALFGETHAPYYISQYDGEIRFTDDQIARLLQFLKDSGLQSRTIVVITADHGETLTEREYLFSHTFRTYDELALVPLIIHFPDGSPGKRISDQVRSIDIMPTLLDRLGLKNPYPVQGQSLMKLISEGKKPTLDFAVVYSDHGLEVFDSVIGAQKSIRTEHWKLTENSRDNSRELYNLDEDPEERHDIARQKTAVADQLDTLLYEWEKTLRRTGTLEPELTPEKIEQLNSLGYIAK